MINLVPIVWYNLLPPYALRPLTPPVLHSPPVCTDLQREPEEGRWEG